MKNKSNKSSIIILLTLFAIIAVLIAAVVYLKTAKPANSKTTVVPSAATDSATTNKNAGTSHTDAKEYYTQNSEKLIAVRAAQNSPLTYSEAEIKTELSERGFGKNAPVKYNYSIKGEFDEERESVETSDEKHPLYTMVYTAKNGDYWNITVCENNITAYPVSYNLKFNDGKTELVIAESDSIVSYDSNTNSFYETIPKKSELNIKKVSKINADTLEKLTAEEIKKL